MEGSSQGTWWLSERDLFQDLSDDEISTVAHAAPTRTYSPGDLLNPPCEPAETLWILKRGRVRVFRISDDGRAVTTAILTPGAIFGEMALLGLHMREKFAECLEESVVCVMSRADVRHLLLSNARIASRITEALGVRLIEMQRRLFETVLGVDVEDSTE